MALTVSLYDRQRFWKWVDRSSGPDACWPWLGTRTWNNYGHFRFDHRLQPAHRVAYMLTHKTSLDDPSVIVGHGCHFRPCCNPAHLYLTDTAGNIADRVAADRSAKRHHSNGDPSTTRPPGYRAKRLTPEEEFWARVDKTGGCWTWIPKGGKIGYGLFFHRGQIIRAHRFSFLLANGYLTEGKMIAHHCDNRRCVRPDHLFETDNDGNMADMYAKGRQRHLRGDEHPARRRPETRPRGVRHGTHTKPESVRHGQENGSSRLTNTAVLDILSLYGAGVPRGTIAQRFAVTPGHISNIVGGSAWRNVAPEIDAARAEARRARNSKRLKI